MGNLVVVLAEYIGVKYKDLLQTDLHNDLSAAFLC